MPSRQTKVTTPRNPSASLLNLAILKDHVRDHRISSETMLDFYAQAAEDQLDGPEGLLALCLRTQTLTHTFKSRDGESYCRAQILFGPIQSIDSVSLGGTALPATDYEFCEDLGIGYVELVTPTTEDLVVVATHGYGDDAADVPANIRAASYLFAAELFRHRGLTLSGPAELVQLVPLFDQIVSLNSRVGQTTQNWSR